MPKLETIGSDAFGRYSAWLEDEERWETYTCSSLESIGDLSNVNYIASNAFSNCTALKQIGDLTNVTRIADSAFWRGSAGWKN